MSPPVLTALRLRYGRHDGRFEVPQGTRPVVIAGPNGSGKSTLLEAFLRALYGFRRRTADERRHLEMRRPWSGRPPEAELEFISTDGRAVAVERDFDTDEVVVRDLKIGTELFRGDANPIGSGGAPQRYRELVGEWIGLPELETYRKTAWIGQGELVETRLDDELLRAAAGTHRKVETAREEIRDEHGDLTRMPIDGGGRRKNLARERETLREAAEALARRLSAARAGRERRRPLVATVIELGQRMDVLDREIELMEAAYRPLTERRSLLAEEREVTARLSEIEDAIRSLSDADGVATRAREAVEAAEASGAYPDDFATRLAGAEVLWERASALERDLAAARPSVEHGANRMRWLAPAAGAVCMSAGLAVAVSVSVAGGTAIAVAGAILTGWFAWSAWTSRRSLETGDLAARATRELADVRARLGALGAGVPAPSFEPHLADDHRAAFGRQEQARLAVRDAERARGEALRRALRVLEKGSGVPEGSGVAHAPEPVLRRLREAEREARTALARIQVRLEEAPATPTLPDGVEATVAAVEAALHTRRGERKDLADQRSRIELDLRDAERVAEDAYSLDRELGFVRTRIEEVEADVEVLRQAWRLLGDAYGEFRERDQGRLLQAVSDRLTALSDGRLGPVESSGDLAESVVRLRGRPVRLESPPLSFGERHVVLFGIRLGSADFLAGEGVRHPLLVDEPFTHLDEDHVRQVWTLLCSLAEERQVIIATQNRLFLDHLGVEPDIELSPRGSEDPEQGGRTEKELAEPRSAGSASRGEAPVAGVAEQAQLELG